MSGRGFGKARSVGFSFLQFCVIRLSAILVQRIFFSKGKMFNVKFKFDFVVFSLNLHTKSMSIKKEIIIV